MTVPHSYILSVFEIDPIMYKLAKHYGSLNWDWEVKDTFSSIVHEIIGQQLSGKASDTIEGRFKSLLRQTDPLSPQEILSVGDETIRRKAGLSYAKISYIKGLSKAVIEKTFDLARIETLPDEEALAALTTLKGIGPWTAEMLLMFTFRRPDIFSLGDAGLRKAISVLYRIERNDEEAILALSAGWKPYRSYAARYLWRSLDKI